MPGTYLNAFYEVRPLPYAEAGYGYPEDGQTVVNVTNGKLIRLLVDDEPFDVRYGTLVSHRRTLDLRAGRAAPRGPLALAGGARDRGALGAPGVLRAPLGGRDPLRGARRSTARRGSWCSPSSSPTRTCRRAARTRARPRSWPRRSSRSSTAPTSCARCSCTARGPERPADGGGDGPHGRRAEGHGHRERELRRPRADDRQRRGRPRRDADADQVPGLRVVQPALDGLDPRPGRRRARVGAAHRVRRPPRGPARVPRRLLGARGRRDRRRRRAPAGRALRPLPHAAVRRPRGEARDRRQGADGRRLRRARLLGHRELRAARAHLHRARHRPRRAALAPLDARPRHRARAHAAPRRRRVPVADDPRPRVLGLLAGRHRRLPRQRRHRRRRAALPARDRRRRVRARAEGSSCWSRPRGCGARWATTTRTARSTSTASRGPTSTRRSPTTTSTRTSWPPGTWPGAAESCARHREEAAALGVDEEEMAAWRDAAAAIAVPYDDELGVHQQSAGYTRHERWDFEATAPDEYPLLLHFPYFDLYRKQVVKQADLVLAMVMAGDRFTARDKARAFAYYEPLTVRDSSLSACVQAIVAAEVGHLELAFDYFGEAALMDLDDLEHNTRDGLHMASLAGSWLAAVAGFGGFRDHAGPVLLRPAAAAAPRAPGLRAHAARTPAARRDRARRGALRAGRRRAARAAPRRHAVHARARQSAGASRGARRRPETRRAAPASRAHPAPAARVRLTAGAVLRWLDRGLPPPQARRKTLPGPRLRGVFLVRPRP